MRKIYLLLLSAIALSAFSQNWAPINSTEKFCYSTDENLDIIDAVLWVDSLGIIGNDSVFHLNKIARIIENQDFVCLNNQPQFLLDDVIVKPNGEWVFVDTAFSEFDQIDTFKILPKANYYESWEFSSDLDAAIANVSTMSIFGQTDSVKTILLSDYSQILISKSHGIINWRGEYQLIGIEGRNLGLKVPRFEDMYSNISVGDVVCFLTYGWEVGNGVVQKFIKRRIEIDSIFRYEDSIVLHVEEWIKTDIIYWSEVMEDIDSQHKKIVLNKNGLTEAYPNELINLHISHEYAWAGGYAIIKLESFRWGGLKKTEVLFLNQEPYTVLLDPCDNINADQYCYNGDLLIMEHSEKYGFLEYDNEGFEWGGYTQIKGVIDDGDTLGYIYPFGIVGSHEISSQENWSLYPNPAKDFITIQFPMESKNIAYKIFNLNGVLLKEGILSQSESRISVKELPKGMYFIELNINGELTTKKWIKN